MRFWTPYTDMKSNLSEVTKLVTQEGHITSHPAGDRVKIQAASFRRTSSRTLPYCVSWGFYCCDEMLKPKAMGRGLFPYTFK